MSSNSNIEIRNPKLKIQNPNDQYKFESVLQAILVSNFGYLSFVLVSDFVLRISDFQVAQGF